jgi:NADH-quinone oxidoreductase subunit G
MRRLAGDDPQVNEEWNCDKGRFGFGWTRQPDRLTTPLVRDEETRQLRPASWIEAFVVTARGLAKARGRTGVLTGGRLTAEDAYAYSKFARVVLGTNNIDFRARRHSAEEAQFLAVYVAGSGLGLTYADLEQARTVVLAGLDPEEEAATIFLRLRKAVRKNGPASVRRGQPHQPRPVQAERDRRDDGARRRGGGAGCARRRRRGGPRLRRHPDRRRAAGHHPRRLHGSPRPRGAYRARLAWVPRRAGDRGAVDAGCLPGLLPAGRTVSDASARADLAAAWGVPALPATPGLDTDAMLGAAAAGQLGALVVAGVDPVDLPDPAGARAALAKVPFLVSMEIRASEVTERADVVLPVAPAVEKSGTFVDWEGRPRRSSRCCPVGTRCRTCVSGRHRGGDDAPVPRLELPDRRAGARRVRRGLVLGRRARARSGRRRRRRADSGTRRVRPGHLEAADRRRPHARRRALPARHRATRHRPAVRGGHAPPGRRGG